MTPDGAPAPTQAHYNHCGQKDRMCCYTPATRTEADMHYLAKMGTENIFLLEGKLYSDAYWKELM